MSREEIERSKEWLFIEETPDGKVKISFREDMQKLFEDLAKKEAKTLDEFVSQAILEGVKRLP